MTSDPRSILTEAPAAELPENALRILEAAVRLFARKGYAATSVREIVQEADVTNPMLYYYFDSKEGLFSALIDLMHREFERELRAVVERGGPFEDVLIGIVEVHIRGTRDSPDALRFVYSLLFGSDSGISQSNNIFECHMGIIALLDRLFADAEEQGEFNPAFDRTWLVYQLLGLANSHSMLLIKELEFVDEEDQQAFLEERTSRAEAERVVRFFLTGASRTE